VPGALGVGAVLAVAADGAEDEARIDRGKRRVADAELVHDAGAETLDDDVRRQSQSAEHGDALGLLQVEAQRALVAVDELEEGAGFARPGAHRTGVVALAGVLDLDDVGAEVGEVLGGDGARQQPGEVEHAQAGKRLAALSHTCARRR
jgi:hypothetical protein